RNRMLVIQYVNRNPSSTQTAGDRQTRVISPNYESANFAWFHSCLISASLLAGTCAISEDIFREFTGCKLGSSHEVQQRAKAAGSSCADEMQTWYRRTDPAGQHRIAVALANALRQFWRQKVVAGNIDIVSRTQQNMMYAAFARIIEAQRDLVAHR